LITSFNDLPFKVLLNSFAYLLSWFSYVLACKMSVVSDCSEYKHPLLTLITFYYSFTNMSMNSLSPFTLAGDPRWLISLGLAVRQ